MLHGAHSGVLELRRSGGETRLSGRFPYGERAVLSDGGRSGRPQKEVIEPGAFSYRVNLPEEDIHLLVGHSFDAPLASKATGTLRLRDGRDALTFDATLSPALAETTHVRNVLALIAAGLAVGISPGFRIPPARAVKPEDAEEIEEEEDEGPGSENRGAIIRHVKQALLYELSIVTRPAYQNATVEMRNWAVTGTTAPVIARAPALRRWRA